MTNPKLVPLLRETQFWAAALIGLPGIALAYVLAYMAGADALGGELTIEDAGLRLAAIAALLTANPITVYLTARQYPRGKSVEAIGIERAADPAAARELDGLELDDDEDDEELAAAVDGALS